MNRKALEQVIAKHAQWLRWVIESDDSSIGVEDPERVEDIIKLLELLPELVDTCSATADHQALDRLMGQYIIDTSRLPSQTSVMDLADWSNRQQDKSA